ncbi:MAG: pentapeptide repeat-containing protein, partial [Cyanobacteria bacterium J06621_11]
IKPYVYTLDLYHSQNIEPRSISIALRELSFNNSDASLEIVALEKRGNSFNLKLKVADSADKSELSAEYFTTYNKLRLLSETNQLLLAEKDVRIQSLESMITTALSQPILSIQGDLSIVEDKKITVIGDVIDSNLVSGNQNSLNEAS